MVIIIYPHHVKFKPLTSTFFTAALPPLRVSASFFIFHFSLFTAPQAPLRGAHHSSLHRRRHCAERIIFHCASGATARSASLFTAPPAPPSLFSVLPLCCIITLLFAAVCAGFHYVWPGTGDQAHDEDPDRRKC